MTNEIEFTKSLLETDNLVRLKKTFFDLGYYRGLANGIIHRLKGKEMDLEPVGIEVDGVDQFSIFYQLGYKAGYKKTYEEYSDGE